LKNGLAILLILSALGFSCAQSDEVLSPEKISKLVPDKIKGFIAGDSKSKLITLGTIRYSMVEKNFTSGKRVIKILLFDYKQASIMYRQVTRNWSSDKPVVSDSLLVHSLTMDNSSGWETYYVKNNSTQIRVGICDRFFLSVEGQNIEFQSLREIVSTFQFNSYPR
jgi:hypothetical protein